MTLIYIEKQKIKLFIKKLFDRQTELKNGLIHIFCCPYYHKTDTGFLFLSSFRYQGRTNKQLASLADICITQTYYLYYKIPLILYC